LADVFPYYAGFSYDWARACVESQPIPADGVILDPWNGSGTTTLAAQHQGFRAIGIDRNPIANVVARLRASAFLGNSEVIPAASVPSLAVAGDDALAAWFDCTAVSRLRSWSSHLSSLPHRSADLGYVALFRTVRKLTRSFEGSNPTWVRRARSDEERVSIDPSAIDESVVSEQKYLVDRINNSSRHTAAPTELITASSGAMPIKTASVDFILTSPPYLTRIDYAVAYARELAVMGHDIARDRSLRAELMGTTLIRQPGSARMPAVGQIAASMLRDISEHSSKASGGYYKKQACQYLSDLTAGLDEVARVAKDGALLYLVVQDSYYKDIPVRLADICVEECGLRGWKLVSASPYPVKRTLTSLNTSARKYKKSDVAETVIALRKGNG
jgi:hypothetical protein